MKDLLALVALMAAPIVSAQSGAWQQCGGINFNSPTTCISGYTCTKLNDYYSQCIPGNAGTMSALSSTRTCTTTTSSTTSPSGPVTTPLPPANTGNPFAGKKQWVNPYYKSEISSFAIPSFVAAGKTALATAAAKVAETPSFIWLDTRAKVPSVRTCLKHVRDQKLTKAIVPFVVYNLPDRDCAALASNGELALNAGGAYKYKTEYINVIRDTLKDFPEIPVVLVIEPDSLANTVTNMKVAKCAGAAEAYKSLTAYAVRQLSLPNVAMYLDGGHGGWLGWPANLPAAAKVFAQIRKAAGSPPQLRGLATNVSNYNGWSLATCPAITSPNPNCDEKRYVEAMVSALAGEGWADSHHIVDQGRSGKQPTGQTAQGNWCNAVGTGFGMRPTSNTGHSSVDAFVWVKPGGESDGTSNTSAVRYDSHCGSSDSLKPAPEAGAWFQAYFEQLLTNANPSFL